MLCRFIAKITNRPENYIRKLHHKHCYIIIIMQMLLQDKLMSKLACNSVVTIKDVQENWYKTAAKSETKIPKFAEYVILWKNKCNIDAWDEISKIIKESCIF